MTNVVSISERIKNKTHGNLEFMLCRKCNGAHDVTVGFAPVVLQDAKGILVVGMICVGCGEDVSFEYGRVVS